MCSYLLLRMDKTYQGDLADIVRASGGSISGASSHPHPVGDWHFPNDPMNYHLGIEDPIEDFGDPFSNMGDPLLQELNMPTSTIFNTSNTPVQMMRTRVAEDTGGDHGGGDGGFNCTTTIFSHPKILEQEEIKRPCNIFSRMLQISPNAKPPMRPSPCDSPAVVAASPRGIKSPAAMLATDHHHPVLTANASNTAALQISSPQNTGIKRRKSQAKKVVCIPAPAPVNSRSSGEVVPSDLWAWRKYGQKPIKGSPYPRGYYRCSSSKGCSARKQVERSRTDPNMLVITYTSEHNHPWPTQRNALAGSTRSQPSKTGASSKNSPGSHGQKTAGLKEEQRESNVDSLSPSMGTGNSASVKEESTTEDAEKQIEMEDGEHELSTTEGFPQSYSPAMPDSNQSHHEDFFADLGEIEADPLNLLFTQGFTVDEGRENGKALDPFSLFDWTGNNNNTSFGEAKRGL